MERHDTIGDAWAGETIDGSCAGLTRATKNGGMHYPSVPRPVEDCSAEESGGHKAVIAVFIIVVRGVVVVIVIVIAGKSVSK